MYNDTIKLLNLEQFNLKIKQLETTKVNNILYCYITLERQIESCPTCGGCETVINDYRIKKIKHSISTNNPCYIVYKARRYKCKYCNTVFYEHNPFSLKNDSISTYTVYAVLRELLRHTNTFSDVAHMFGLSVYKVINIFDNYVEFRRPTLPKILCFDEFYRSRKSKEKYAFIMADFLTSKIVDIYYTRNKNKLNSYFCRIHKSERDNVDYIIIDMWDSYRDLAEICFKNAKIAVDSFHVIKHLNEAMISIRLKIMKKYDKRTKSLQANDMYYYMLKKFHYFFVKEFDDIYSGLIEIRKMKTKWDKYEIRKYLMSIDPDLQYAYNLKEKYREFNLTASFETCDEELEELIEDFRNSHLEEFRQFGKLIKRWKPYIKNSFIRVNNKKRLSNGPMEGINSRIKTILKSSNGIKKFFRLRNRAAYSINKNVPIKGTPKNKIKK